MANGTYGIKKPAFITSNDCDIFYNYRKDRSSETSDDFANNKFKKLDSSILSTTKSETNNTDDDGNMILPGMYDIKLPLDKFSEKGIYTVYIKPKEIYLDIVDVSTLVNYPNVRGIVLDATSIGEYTDSSDGSLVGYRVEYINEDTGLREDFYRIITSNNKCEPVAQSTSDSLSNGVKYRFNTTSNLVFCTLTPSTSMSFKSSSTPYIGDTSQRIVLINTKFNPIMLEIEMVDHDADTISTMLEGKQIRNLDTGLITTFDSDGEIYHQAEYGTVVSSSNGINHDFKFPLDGIQSSEKNNLTTIEDNIK